MGKEKHRKPIDNLLKSKYHEKLKEFKTYVNQKDSLFGKINLRIIEKSLTDPKLFWEKWENAKELDTPQQTNI